jgi:hypothetical protein
MISRDKISTWQPDNLVECKQLSRYLLIERKVGLPVYKRHVTTCSSLMSGTTLHGRRSSRYFIRR